MTKLQTKTDLSPSAPRFDDILPFPMTHNLVFVTRNPPMKASFAIRLVRFIAAWLFVLCISLVACVLFCLVGPKRMWVSMMPLWSKGSLWIVGIKLRIEGQEHLQKPGVYISNHTSLIDVVVLPGIVPKKVRVVAKRELLYVPFMGWAFAVSGAILVNRKKARSAITSLREALKQLPKGWSLAIFPEGTRSTDGTLRPFKKGAFHMALETGLPIVPIAMDGAQDVSPPGHWLVQSGEIRIFVGEPIPVAAASSDDPELVRNLLAQSFEAVAACHQRAIAMRHSEQPFNPGTDHA